MNIQSAYQQKATICRFESRMDKKSFSAGGYGEVKKGFVFEDSNKKHMIMNDSYNFLKSEPPHSNVVGIHVVVKNATGDSAYAKVALRNEIDLLGGVLSDHPNIVQMLPRQSWARYYGDAACRVRCV